MSWSSAIPIVNAILSAVISYFVAKYVASRGVKKQAFVDLLRRIDELEELAEGLFLVSGADEEAHSLYRSVVREDRRFGERLTEVFTEFRSKASLAGPDPVPFAITTALNKLRAIVTPDELLAPTRAAYPANHMSFHELRAASTSLRRAIRDEAQDLKADHLQA